MNSDKPVMLACFILNTMTYEEKLARLKAAKQRIYYLREKVLWHIERRDRVDKINRTIDSLNKAYCKYNQLRLKYWICDESRLP